MKRSISPIGRKAAFQTIVACLAATGSLTAGTLNLALPQLSAHRIVLHGDVNQNRGIAGMVPQITATPSHQVTSLNCRPEGSHAYMYLIGRENADYTHTAIWYTPWGCYIPNTPVVNTATESAVGTAVHGMPQTTAFFAVPGRSVADLAFLVGQRAGRPIQDTWSLAPDVLHQDYYCDPEDTVEERLYKGDGAKLLASFSYKGQVILEFDYSPLKMILDYRTTNQGDDEVKAYSHPVGYTIPPGLAGDAFALATALDADIQAAGGRVQLRLDTIQPTSRTDFISNNASYDVYGVFTFSGSFMAVPDLVRPVLDIKPAAADFRVSWDSELNVLYRLQYRDSLVIGDWENLGDVRPGNGLRLEVPVVGDAEQRFYQILFEPQ